LSLSRAPAFVVISIALVVVMATAGVPAPMYSLYRQITSITTADVTVSFAIYVIFVALTLISLGRLSDHVGRRAIAALALGLAVASCIVLANVDGAGVLYAGRLLQGVSSGLAASAMSAYVIDLQHPKHPARGAIVTSVGPTLGLATGALISGALVSYGPSPAQLVYIIFGALGTLALCAVLFVPETVVRSSGAVRSLRPAVRVPHRLRRLFATVGLAAAACYALSGFFQSLGASLVATNLGTTDIFIGGLVVASAIGATALGGLLSPRISSVFAMAVGLSTIVIGVLGVLGFLTVGSFPGFFVSSVISGLGFGCAFSGGMRSLAGAATVSERASVIAAIYLACYSGAAVPALLTGALEPTWGLNLVSVAYCWLVIGLAALALLLLFLGRRGHVASSQALIAYSLSQELSKICD
jgi:MFS family permease